MAVRTNSLIEPLVSQVTEHGVEAWALRTNRLHPEVVEFLQPLFDSTVGLQLSTVRMIVYTKNTSGLGTSVWVMGDKIVWRMGHLNQEHAYWRGSNSPVTYKQNGAVDLATPGGMKILCHELFHCHQWRRQPWWKSLWLYAYGVARSLWFEHRWYSHGQVPAEVEAIVFQKGPAADYIYGHREQLKRFEALR